MKAKKKHFGPCRCGAKPTWTVVIRPGQRDAAARIRGYYIYFTAPDDASLELYCDDCLPKVAAVQYALENL